MTERIDLDDFEADESTADDRKPRGSWFWEGDGDPDEEADPWGRTDAATPSGGAAVADATPSGDAPAVDAADTSDDGDDEDDEDDDTADRAPIPRVPRTNEDRPVGIPMDGGGSGGAAAGAVPDEPPPGMDGVASGATGSDSAAGGAASTAGGETGTATTPTAPDAGEPTAGDDSDAAAAPDAATTDASGPHGGGVDEMTLAFTYNAITRLSQLHGALADANEWTDWIGLVGDVEAYVINKFQRDNHLDLDFFNGSGTGPGERLAAIDEHSMFYAERMVVVGVAGEDESVAEEAGWEFVPLEDAAAKAGWDVDDA